MTIDDRLDALRRFAASALGNADFSLAPASADASFRSYWRLTHRDGTHVVMDAPPMLEDITPWLDVERRLRAADLHAPAVLAQDLDRGFLLLEDLGTRTLLPELTDTTVDALYGDALDALFTMQTRVDAAGLPHCDASWLIGEMELMPTWFFERHLGLVPGCDGWDTIELTFRELADSLLEQPQRFMHRDFHSRNLMITDANTPGIIDFQGARVGPVAYDLVSLLRDCYIDWPADRVLDWAEAYRQRLVATGVCEISASRFRHWFDFAGLQRHLKVLGIFCRLWYRDGKRQYLADLPRVLRYVLDVTGHYPRLAGFRSLIARAVAGRDVSQPRDP